MPSNIQDDKCVRCGACLSQCPVYGVTLKERFSPRGRNFLLKTGKVKPRDRLVRETIKACLQCGACSAVCTSGADVSSLIRNERASHGFFRTLPVQVYNLFASEMMSMLCARVGGMLGPMPTPAEKPFLSNAAWWAGRYCSRAEQLGNKKALPRVAIFAGCAQNMLYPEIPGKIAAIAGNRLVVPAEQTCCGLPAFSAGAFRQAKKVVLRNIEAFEPEEFDILLTGCASCASMIKKWPLLFEQDSAEKKAAEDIASRVMEFSCFALEFLKPSRVTASGKLCLQMPCHQRFGYGQADAPLLFLRAFWDGNFQDRVLGCCGQGGLFGFTTPDLSLKILEQALAGIEPDVQAVCTTCSGCLMRLKQAMSSPAWTGRQIKAMHLVDVIIPD